MTSIARTRWTAAVLGAVLAVATLAGCGSEESEAAPETTSLEQYCEAYEEYFQERASLGSQASDAEVVASMKGWATQLGELDAPEEMPEDARAGMRRWRQLMGELADDATQQDVLTLEQEMSQEETAQVQAFFSFNGTHCLRGGAGG